MGVETTDKAFEIQHLEQLKDQINGNAFGRRRLTVFVPGTTSDQILRELMSLERVESLVIVGERTAPDFLKPDRIGWLLAERGKWVLPARLGDLLVCLVPLPTMSGAMLAKACAKGACRLSYWEEGEWKSTSLFRLLPGKLSILLVKFLVSAGTILLRYFVRFLIRLSISVSALAWARPLIEKTFQTRFSKIEAGFSTLAKKAPAEQNRIILVNTALAPGGAERQIVNTVLGLRKAGYTDVSIFCNALSGVVDGLDSGFHLETLTSAGVDVRVVGERNANLLDGAALAQDHSIDVLGHLPWRQATFALPYFREFVSRRPQVVHLWQDYTNVLVGFAALLAGVPNIILSTRNMAPIHFGYYQPWMWAGYRALLRQPNVRILNNSQAGAESYSEWLDLPPDEIAIVYNGFEVTRIDDDTYRISKEEERNRLGIPLGAPVVGSVFRFWNEKDPILWIRAAGKIAMKKPDCVFVIFGAGPMLGKIMAEAEKQGIKDKLFLPGVSRDVSKMQTIMDVFMLSSRFEGLPNTVIEAQMHGVPVVTTNAGGAGEAIEPDITGWLVTDRNPHTLADRVLFIIDHPEWTKSARARARSFVESKFSAERMVRETIALYGIDGEALDHYHFSTS